MDIMGTGSEASLEDFLSQFGITQARDGKGQMTWTIDIFRTTDRSQPLKASLNPDSKLWSILPESLSSRNTSQECNHLMHGELPSHVADWWVRMLPDTIHTTFLVNTNWSATPLRHIESWSPSLRSYTTMCLSKSLPTLLVWGSDRTAIYNEAAIPLLGKRHPDLMGGAVSEKWPDVAEGFVSELEELKRSGEGKIVQSFSLTLERYEYLEETWWDADLLPLKEDNGLVSGFCFTWFEITRQVILDRYSRIVNEIGRTLNDSDHDAWQHIHKVASKYPHDVSMCILYSAATLDDGCHRLKREATIGVGTDHPAAPSFVDLENDDSGLAPLFRLTLEKEEEFLVLDTSSNQVPAEVVQDINWQGYAEASRYLAIVPVYVFNNLLKGFMVIGLNPRIAMDTIQQQFLSDLGRQLRALLTAVTNNEQAKRREEKLVRDLAAKEKRIRKMAQLAPMGMYDLSAEGKLLWANNHFFDILGAQGSQNNFATFSWLEVIHPDDHEAANRKMASSIIEQLAISDSLRLRKTWLPPDVPDVETEKHEEEPAWILYQAYPHIENGAVESIMGCITDISQFKWAERVQARSADAARAAKQRLEDFIDITSHEMRNPLSAVTQCADDILNSVADAQNFLNIDQTMLEELNQIADTAKSIALCATHQRRIIDDVLTLSKLDSSLLSVVPVASRPSQIMADAMKMFTAEFATSGIQVDVIDESPGLFEGEDHAYLDATRLMQVLVNLITNAIKFTRAEDIREVTIRYGATESPPEEAKFGPDFSWSISTRKRRDLSSDFRYGDGPSIYLFFSVQDTGQGLPKKEAVHIFDKFIQANRRTYIKYGGSGLGLFISRELIELQSGKIGVSSETGKGSTFAFYVKAKKGREVQAPDAQANSFEQADIRRPRRESRAINSAQLQDNSTSITNTDTEAPDKMVPPVISPLSSSLSTNNTKGDKLNLLLVEDNLVNQKVLAKQLRKCGFTVAIANHGGEAVDRLLHIAGRKSEYETPLTPIGSHPITFDCVLMDWEMPVLDGLSATRKIRELEEAGIIRPRQIIIGVTANARNEQIEMAKAAGMDEIVVKPFRVPDLVARIRDYTG